MEIKNNYPLFLPNVTKTYTDSSNALTDSDTRLKEARKALFYIIEKNYFDKIVIVDGSNNEVLTKEEILSFAQKGVVIEQILFQQNSYEVAQFGKSQGEMQITNYMIANSELVKKSGGFTKISPRYIFDNIDQIIPVIFNKKNIFYLYHPPIIRKKITFACTIFYKTSIEFYKKHLAESIHECDKDVHGYLESVFYRKLSKIKKMSIYSEFPHFSGIAGTTGKGIKNHYYYARNILSKIGLMCYEYDK